MAFKGFINHEMDVSKICIGPKNDRHLSPSFYFFSKGAPCALNIIKTYWEGPGVYSSTVSPSHFKAYVISQEHLHLVSPLAME